MDAPAQTIVATGTDEATGYTSYRLGGFEFRRDEYFAHIEWPRGSHIIEIDRFLRAMVRDIGWGFFYGWIFFDDIFGTTNHYGTVDVFAGSYDAGYKAQGIDHLETFPADVVSEAFTTISKNWISEGYDPLNAPLETGTPIGPKGKEKDGELLRSFIAADRMLGLPGDKMIRTEDDGFSINRAFADLEYDKPEIETEEGFEGQLHAINLFDHIARSDITWNPSISAVTRGNICCVTSEEHMLPVIHGNDRNEWFIQLTDEIHWNIADKNTGSPRGKIVMKAGDVCAMPADIRHQGFAPKRSMLMVLENGTPGLEKRYASGELKPYPVDFG
ncbi:hydroxyquinol 1,2-dioxygenase [Tsuneonella sp. HG222]